MDSWAPDLYALVMELVYVSVLEAEFCETESHPVHQINSDVDERLKSAPC